MTGARQRLRDGLATLHDRLDARITAACLSPVPDLRRLLAIHCDAFPPVVAGLLAADAVRLWPEWDGPERVAALFAEAGSGVRSTVASQAERFEGDAMAWGGLYALLGSRLGNRVIVRRLAEAGERHDSAFLRHRPDDAQEWRRFLETMEAALGEVQGADAYRDAIEGATRVLARYLRAVEADGLPERIGDTRY